LAADLHEQRQHERAVLDRDPDAAWFPKRFYRVKVP